MNTERFALADEVWEKASPHLPGKVTDCGVTAADNRLFLEAVLWRVRTGSPWRDLPVAFGKSNSVFQRFRRWAKKVYSSDCLRFYRRNRTSNTPSSTVPSSAFTRRRAAQGGDSQSGDRTIERGPDHQDYRLGGCLGELDPFRATTRSAP